MVIDIAFDFRSDAKGRDPDSHSPTLRSYHRLLWSKPLPSGASFDLSDTTPGVYLHHRSGLGEVIPIERFGDTHVHEVVRTEADH